VRTNTLVKNCIVVVDAAPFRQWYATHYGIELGKKKHEATTEEPKEPVTEVSNSVLKKRASRATGRILDPTLEEQFSSGRLLACVSSRPGQIGRADGYILEGPELSFYKRKLEKKKSK
jgi:small subunit ribosomal protein S8e